MIQGFRKENLCLSIVANSYDHNGMSADKTQLFLNTLILIFCVCIGIAFLQPWYLICEAQIDPDTLTSKCYQDQLKRNIQYKSDKCVREEESRGNPFPQFGRCAPGYDEMPQGKRITIPLLRPLIQLWNWVFKFKAVRIGVLIFIGFVMTYVGNRLLDIHF